MTENPQELRIEALEARVTRLERLNETLTLKANRAYGLALVAIAVAILGTLMQSGLKGAALVAGGGVLIVFFVSALLLVASIIRAAARPKTPPERTKEP